MDRLPSRALNRAVLRTGVVEADKRTAMVVVIRFPEEAAGLLGCRTADAGSEPATVIILPVVRIDRSPDDTVEPHTGNGPHRGRRRRLGR